MLGIYYYFGFNMPLRDRFKLVKATGFDAVGLWCDDWFGSTGHREYADIARSEGLLTLDGHAPFTRDYEIVNSLWLDNLDGETTFETYQRAVNECGEDGISNLVIHIHERNAPPPNELGITRLRRLVDTAEKRNVKIAIENIFTNSYLTYAFERIDSPNFGFCFDSGHGNCFEPDADLLSMFGHKLIMLHLHDNDGTGDQHKLPFTGSINWREKMAKIGATGYSGPITLECAVGGPGSKTSTEPDNRTAEEWLRDAYNAAKRLYDMMQGK